jgi:drug/metabolite transporter (DMT)-like permease
MNSPPPRWRTDLALALVCLTWGATFILVKEALADASTLLFLAIRFAIAAVVLAIVFHRHLKGGPATRLALRGGLIAGVFLFAGYVLQTLGLNSTGASKAAFITGLYIPLVPLVGALIYRRLPSAYEAAGVILAAVGMGLMTYEPSAGGITRGDLLVSGCAVAFAFHIVILGHFAKEADTAALAVTQIATCALLSGASFGWAEPIHLHWTPRLISALLITSLLATALAFAIQTWAQQYRSPTRTAIIFSLEPVFAWAASWILAGELLSRRALAGAVLIMAGILTVELKPFRRANHPSS